VEEIKPVHTAVVGELTPVAALKLCVIALVYPEAGLLPVLHQVSMEVANILA
jgi:hypothetical protein